MKIERCEARNASRLFDNSKSLRKGAPFLRSSTGNDESYGTTGGGGSDNGQNEMKLRAGSWFVWGEGTAEMAPKWRGPSGRERRVISVNSVNSGDGGNHEVRRRNQNYCDRVPPLVAIGLSGHHLRTREENRCGSRISLAVYGTWVNGLVFGPTKVARTRANLRGTQNGSTRWRDARSGFENPKVMADLQPLRHRPFW